MTSTGVTTSARVAAGLVHSYTAVGVVLALLMVHLSYQGDVRAVLWLFLAVWPDWLVAVLAWERCDAGNGWATLSMSPVNEETAGFLTRLSRVLVDGPENPESLN